jgi:putative Ca2+/H+ antiporter (TMEM165/GDT1 family)
MQWNAFATAFSLVFLAEMGDKTQLAALTLAANTRRPVEVALGAIVALALVTILGVAVGGALAQLVPMGAIRTAAALLFVVVGVGMLLGVL